MFPNKQQCELKLKQKIVFALQLIDLMLSCSAAVPHRPYDGLPIRSQLRGRVLGCIEANCMATCRIISCEAGCKI